MESQNWYEVIFHVDKDILHYYIVLILLIYYADMVVVFMAKVKPVNWSSMTSDEKKLKDAAAPKVDAATADDPNAGMMSQSPCLINYD